MKAIVGGTIITETEELQGYALVFDQKIVDICKESELPEGIELIDASGGYVTAGLIDIHNHGGMLKEVSYCSLDDLRVISENIAKNGVTAWCPTTLTLKKADLEKAFSVIKSAKEIAEKGEWRGAEVLGVNSEGPFVNPEKKGAQTEEFIIPPDPDFVLANKDIIKIVTVAPEMDKDFEFIKRVTAESEVVVSLGHSTADYKTASGAFSAGASHVTHLFNAMPPLSHRDPSLVGAALENPKVTVELIADTVHVHPALFEAVAKAKGDGLVLITDNIAPAGMPDGEYMSGAEKVKIENNSCRLLSGALAGSIYKFSESIKNFKKHTALSLVDIVKAATLSPARVLGVDKERGSLKIGKRADIVIMDSDFDVISTFILGKKF